MRCCRLGFEENGGSCNLSQFKIIREVITLLVLTPCAVCGLKTDKLGRNHVVGFGRLVAAVRVSCPQGEGLPTA